MNDAARTPVPPVAGLRDEALRVLRLAFPVMIAYLGTISMGTIDMMMSGALGPKALGAVALGHMWCIAASIIAWGAARALDPVVAQARGAGDTHAAGLGLTRGLAMASVLGLPVLALYLFADHGLTALGQPRDLVPTAAAYCRVLVPGLPAVLAFAIVRNFLQALGVVRPATYAIVLANITNVFLNWVLMFGKLGCPALGVRGCGLSTAINQWLMLASVLFFARRTMRAYWPGWAGAFDPAPLSRMMKLGLTLGLQFGFEVWAFHAAGFMMGRLGASAFAAHAITINLSTISFMVPSGIGAAAATRVGQLVRAGHAWARSASVAVGLGALVMIVPAATFVIAARALTGFYSADPAVVATAVAILPIAGAFQLSDGIQAVAFGVLRGAGDTRVPAVANVVGYWLLGLPAGWFLAFVSGWGPRGVWCGLAIGLAAVAALLLVRIARLAKRGVRRLRI
jgi:multidrug resistance protein, MATE family